MRAFMKSFSWAIDCSHVNVCVCLRVCVRVCVCAFMCVKVIFDAYLCVRVCARTCIIIDNMVFGHAYVRVTIQKNVPHSIAEIYSQFLQGDEWLECSCWNWCDLIFLKISMERTIGQRTRTCLPKRNSIFSELKTMCVLLNRKANRGCALNQRRNSTVCCIKIETNFVWEKWHFTTSKSLLLGVHWPLVVILVWWHQQKTKECTSFGCSAKFLLGVWDFSLYKFSHFLEKRLCHCSRSYQFFCHQAICSHCLLHPKPSIFIWKKPRHIWCADTSDLWGQKFPTQHPAVCVVLLPWLWESGFECVGFSLHKWKFLPSSRF